MGEPLYEAVDRLRLKPLTLTAACTPRLCSSKCRSRPASASIRFSASSSFSSKAAASTTTLYPTPAFSTGSRQPGRVASPISRIILQAP